MEELAYERKLYRRVHHGVYTFVSIGSQAHIYQSGISSRVGMYTERSQIQIVGLIWSYF